ncbi:MAG: TetR family transcriptional regulator [Deltaproteobacteria bacterium 13_1_20CM_2_69_21]|nr:MAG: TetR family transcriptional regulator [Deltaproteobacteria bacterium 13_1_20CM_2_69_21]
MPKRSHRDNLLDAGRKVMFERGYRGAGVRDIVSEAGAPQGSFTNHFRSKEAFAGEVLDQYFDYLREIVQATLGDRSLSPRGRIRRYFDVITGKLKAEKWALGCLIGNLSLEVSTESKPLRTHLSNIFAEWREPFAACIAEAQAAGEIADNFPARDLADFLLAGWHGAMLRMKVDRSSKPLEQFKAIAFATVLARRPR